MKKEAGKSSAPVIKRGPIDSKKAQNIAIQLRALNISTQDVCDALLEGDFLAYLVIILVFNSQKQGVIFPNIVPKQPRFDLRDPTYEKGN